MRIVSQEGRIPFFINKDLKEKNKKKHFLELSHKLFEIQKISIHELKINEEVKMYPNVEL